MQNDWDSLKSVALPSPLPPAAVRATGLDMQYGRQSEKQLSGRGDSANGYGRNEGAYECMDKTGGRFKSTNPKGAVLDKVDFVPNQGDTFRLVS